MGWFVSQHHCRNSWLRHIRTIRWKRLILPLVKSVKQGMTEGMAFHLDLERWDDFGLNCLAPYLIFINSISIMEYENLSIGILHHIGRKFKERLWWKYFQNNYQVVMADTKKKELCVFYKQKFHFIKVISNNVVPPYINLQFMMLLSGTLWFHVYSCQFVWITARHCHLLGLHPSVIHSQSAVHLFFISAITNITKPFV